MYDLQVSEGASINSTVATIIAVDPEKDPVTYSILTGNDLRQFAIGYKSGVISVIRKLDREDLTRYQLVSQMSSSYLHHVWNTSRVKRVRFRYSS